MATVMQTKSRNDYGRWRKALKRSFENGLHSYAMTHGRIFVTSGSILDAGYTTDGYECECAAAEHGDPICQHRAHYWHISGRLLTDDELYDRADAAEAAYLEAFDALMAAIKAGERDLTAVEAAVDAAQAVMIAACDEVLRAGLPMRRPAAPVCPVCHGDGFRVEHGSGRGGLVAGCRACGKYRTAEPVALAAD